MKKTLIAVCGAAVLFAASSLYAQGGRDYGRPGFHGAGPMIAAHRGYPSGGRYWHGHYGHYYYLGGVPYFFPFDDPFYSAYYSGPYGYGYAGPYGYYEGANGPDGPNGSNGYYDGRINRDNSDSRASASLPQAVQKQLAKRGYYKGTIDGDFGPASKSALSKFQRDNDLKPTGRIDAETLKALGFDDQGDRD